MELTTDSTDWHGYLHWINRLIRVIRGGFLWFEKWRTEVRPTFCHAYSGIILRMGYSQPFMNTAEKSACGLPSNVVINMAKAPMQRTDAEWSAMLTPMQFRVARKQGTEPPFQNEF